MSISRQIVRDLFRLLDEPLLRGPPSRFGALNHVGHRYSLFDNPNFGRPALDVREEGNKYILEAELPGVKKENIEVRIGDGGKSVTIEGKVIETRGQPKNEEVTNGTTESAEGDMSTSTAVTNAATGEVGNQISSERTFINNTSFQRTVWLPRPVDGQDVVAKLDHGILTITVKKANDKGSVVVPIE